MARKSRIGMLSASALAVLLMGCVEILTIEPQEAVNPVGTTHTVIGTYYETDLVSCETIPVLCDVSASAPIDNFFFEIIQGPNAGLHSERDCGPSRNAPCYIEPPEGSISWTYRGSGGTGTDVIQFCPMLASNIEDSKDLLAGVVEMAAQRAGVSETEFLRMMDDANDDAEVTVDPGCVGATKTWVEDRRSQPNIGAGLSGLFQGQPTPLPTAPAPAVAPAAASQGIRPPSTGDAALK